MSEQTTVYGWSISGRTRYFHRAITWERGIWHYRAKCDGGSVLDQTSTERHSIPAHLKACPKCFKEARS